jgi:hypothetical protein
MLLWCPLCRKKVEVSNAVTRQVLVNHGSRMLAEGTDSKGHKVAQYVSANPSKVAPKRVSTVKRHKKKKIRGLIDL